MSSNQKNANPDAFIANAAKGLKLSGRSAKGLKTGTALTTVGLVLYAKAMSESADPEQYTMFIRNVAGIHVNGKEQPEVYESAVGYWKNIFSGIDLTLSSAEDIEDLEDRREENTGRSSHNRTLRTATSVVYALHNAKVDWKQVTPSQSQEKFVMTQDAARMVWPEKNHKAIANQELGVLVTSYAQFFSFTSLATIGSEALVKNGHKKAPRQASSKAKPVRDLASEMRKVVEGADTKSIDKLTGLELLNLVVSIVDRLNDVDVKEAYIPTSDTRVARDAFEKRIIKLTSDDDAKMRAAIAASVGKAPIAA